MKVKITKAGVFTGAGKDLKELEVGATMTVKGEKLPPFLVGKCAVIASEAGKTPVSNAKSKKRQGLEQQATAAGVAFNDEMSDDDIADAIKKAKS